MWIQRWIWIHQKWKSYYVKKCESIPCLEYIHNHWWKAKNVEKRGIFRKNQLWSLSPYIYMLSFLFFLFLFISFLFFLILFISYLFSFLSNSFYFLSLFFSFLFFLFLHVAGIIGISVCWSCRTMPIRASPPLATSTTPLRSRRSLLAKVHIYHYTYTDYHF